MTGACRRPVSIRRVWMSQEYHPKGAFDVHCGCRKRLQDVGVRSGSVRRLTGYGVTSHVTGLGTTGIVIHTGDFSTSSDILHDITHLQHGGPSSCDAFAHLLSVNASYLSTDSMLSHPSYNAPLSPTLPVAARAVEQDPGFFS